MPGLGCLRPTCAYADRCYCTPRPGPRLCLRLSGG